MGRGTNVVMEVSVGGEPTARMCLDALGPTDFSRNLVQMRSNLLEEVPPTLETGARLAAVENPAFVVPSTVRRCSPGRVMMTIRHPGLGWLAFWFPNENAQKLGQALVDQSKQQ